MAMTRGGSRRRRGALVAALATAGVLLWPASTAWADGVTFTPAEAQQGNSVKLEFVVPDERPGVRTERIEIRMPVETPVAEVYPLSVEGWAPAITPRKLDVPIAGMHGPATDVVTAALTWTRASGPAAQGPARLVFSMAPLPQTEQVQFALTQTYADGLQVHWGNGPGQRPLPALTLTPGDPAYPGAAHGAHGAAPGGAAPGDPAPAAATPDEGPNANSLLAAGLVAGLGGGAVIGWLISRRRRRTAEEIDRSVLDEQPTAEPTADADPAQRRDDEVVEAGANR
ncbi:DUF1775 domain-containing protein [Verrucosispora sp. NA02020]|uniref:DUF1775 domain-containing protein n=1 Tax=Verrucosispora sp. NA02020 TaxID=2742132 RepID=UPI001590474C|nr:DUF1775 domain-containing protein [Verrucosispora sp. NA02020]QKW13196.1 DUF1775 domain-containing protein [Verrucosispora sp. NA02020]